jgi:predicted Zn-dependent protease
MALRYQVTAIKLIPTSKEAETVAGRYYEAGDFLAARDILKGLAAVYPDNPGYQGKLIQTLILVEESDYALDRCNAWIFADTESVLPKLLKTKTLIEKGSRPEARRFLEEAARQQPELKDIEPTRQSLDLALQGRGILPTLR